MAWSVLTCVIKSQHNAKSYTLLLADVFYELFFALPLAHCFKFKSRLTLLQLSTLKKNVSIKQMLDKRL